MAYKISWSSRAKSDLDKIITYLEQDPYRPHAANDLLDAMKKTFLLLTENPELYGFVRADSRGLCDYRKALVKHYVVIYSFDGTKVAVHRIFHMRQNYGKFI